jgi:hypothetical protein
MLPAAEGLDLVPNLSAANLSALAMVKDRMRERDHSSTDFDVGDWAAPEFLASALPELGADA